MQSTLLLWRTSPTRRRKFRAYKESLLLRSNGTVDGPVVAIYGGTSFHYIEALRNPRWEDYEVELLPMKVPNRFEYLGNGFTKREVTNGSVADTQTLGFDEYWNLFVLPEIYS